MDRRQANIAQANSGVRSRCKLCGAYGDWIYEALQDRHFGVRGKWNLAQCSNNRCALIWLDPCLTDEEISLAYANYYTHSVASIEAAPGLIRRAYHAVRRRYIYERFGYSLDADSVVPPLVSRVLYLFPLRREQANQEVRYLNAVPNGRLLDVGCGGGDWLLLMKQLGWQVDGVDFDREAVKIAAGRGLRVHCGSLHSARYPPSYFDAVTLNHVIEHVTDPVAVLAECKRLLKPGGQLVLFTPNGGSLGHRLCRHAWRGLEPPRHLNVFCPSSLYATLRAAGFEHLNLHTVNSVYMWQESIRLRYEDSFRHPASRGAVTIGGLLLSMAEQALLLMRPDLGECLAAKATRN